MFSVFDQCAAETSGCEQSCIHSGEGFSCDCNLGFTLNDDRKTCKRGTIILENVRMLLFMG